MNKQNIIPVTTEWNHQSIFRVGNKIDESSYIHEIEHIEYSVNKLKQNENE